MAHNTASLFGPRKNDPVDDDLSLPPYLDAFEKLQQRLKTPSKELLLSKFALRPSITIRELLQTPIDQINDETVFSLQGWLSNKPKKIGSQLYFANLRDCNGDVIQIVDKSAASKLKNILRESCIQVQGSLKHLNNRPEIHLTDLQILNQSNEKPSQSTDTIPQQYRFLQLRQNLKNSLLVKRHEINKFMSNWLDDKNFKQIETPILFKPTPEGAREFLVPTRSSDTWKHTQFYSLAQSPQQFKQLLMSSGIHKYYQWARCFRDEDLRQDRQPEFTQLDLEMSFVNGNHVSKLVSKLVVATWLNFKEKVHTINPQNFNIEPTSSKLTYLNYNDVMCKFGIDKPNLRATKNLIIDNLTSFNVQNGENTSFPTVDIMIARNVIHDLNDYDSNWSHITNDKNFNYRSPIAIPILSHETKLNWLYHLPHLKFDSHVNIDQINAKFNIQIGDIVYISNRQPDNEIFENPTPMGRLRQLLLNDNKLSHKFIETDGDVALWVINFPLFSPVETNNQDGDKYPVYTDQIISTHHPFTMIQLDSYDQLAHNPLKCVGQHYDLVINGMEIGGGSTRIHDAHLQRYILENILKVKHSDKLFGHLLQAFEMGTPPHAGFAIGFDRLCAILLGRESIRDVIAFPKSINGTDLVVKSPSSITQSMLDPYNITFK